MWKREREGERECGSVWKREREGERECGSVWKRERESVSVKEKESKGVREEGN